MLLQIRDFIKREQVVSSQQLVREFNIDEHALQPILDVWIKKGVIEKCQEKAGCQSGCALRCKANAPKYYQLRNDT